MAPWGASNRYGVAWTELDPAVTYFDTTIFFDRGVFFMTASRDPLAGVGFWGILEEEAAFEAS